PYRALDDLVLDVGDVRHESHVEPGPLEVAPQDVVLERRPAVPEMWRAVHSWAAEVDRHLARFAERELADLPRGGVVQTQHPASLRAAYCPTHADSSACRARRLRPQRAVPRRP